HEKLPADLQAMDLDDVLPLAEDYSINELLPLLMKGGFMDEEKRNAAAEQMARYSGISAEVILQYNLDVPTSFFWKELLRDEGHTVGRLDSRYKGLDRAVGGDSPDFNSEITAWLHAFTPAINYYFPNELGYETDIKYNMFGSVRPWDRSGDTTGEDLRQAMAQNPYLHTMFQSGYYDGATKYFDAKYTMWQLDPSGRMKDRLSFKGYRSGHMMYLRYEDLELSNQDIREFIEQSLPPEGMPAKY
ncbi:MAG: carboxypeptidase, partial [Balneolales bacterium]|nr:carboxypeptidase [Balneolales bacterium]